MIFLYNFCVCFFRTDSLKISYEYINIEWILKNEIYKIRNLKSYFQKNFFKKNKCQKTNKIDYEFYEDKNLNKFKIFP